MINIEYYNKLYHDSVAKIQSDNYELDKLIDSNDDRRFGISLILRPDESIKERIQNFLSKLKSVEPNQYYYPNSDIHVTVMSIISCYDGFRLDQISIDDYIEAVMKSLNNSESFDISFKGITASPSCVLVQGFMENNNLNLIRNRLRSVFKSTQLEQSMDVRYALRTAHSTVVRLKENLEQKQKFLDVLKDFRDINFGTMRVGTLDLVYNDWYQRVDKVKTLYQFPLV
ncbi:2'-5' RNA ligase family protein [Flammeovirga sp. EKP202]|uniref:2'-5' RNA ligase family protein n=1 Tax=Flammeovirga sp. EKP202 TaxID=2770592 RepID=UPI00165F4875|nr:2'-5' RNA ligase family protein [Flammeovirga sp. EKP202]MBD0403277.1 mutarotase [Flammeovirga sp. EKP202]